MVLETQEAKIVGLKDMKLKRNSVAQNKQPTSTREPEGEDLEFAITIKDLQPRSGSARR